MTITEAFKWGVAFASLLTLSRLTTLAAFADLPVLHALLFPFACLFSIGYLVFLAARRFDGLLALVTVIVVSLEVVAFHYQAAFASLPGYNVIYYLTETDELLASIDPLIALSVGIQIIILSGLLIGLSRTFSVSGQQTSTMNLAVVLVCVAAVYFQVRPLYDEPHERLSATEPLGWLIRSAFVPAFSTVSPPDTSTANTSLLALHDITGSAVDGYPACITRSFAAPSRKPTPIVIVLLESVSRQDMYRTVDAKPVMPNLQRIAGENLIFDNFVAAGSKSAQSTVATFSGLSVNPLRVLLHISPMLTFGGFPQALTQLGYDTAYFHGADLQFENQDRFLRQVGFQALHSRHPDKPHTVRGWGYDDGVMFGELRTWLKAQGTTPSFAVLATLTTHDPYVLPPDWKPGFVDEVRTEIVSLFDASTEGAQIEAYHFTDHHLGEFHDWFTSTYPDGLLIITADHPLQTNLTGDPADMHVPMVIAGKTVEGTRLKGRNSTIATHYDISATVAALTGAELNCSIGLNLLGELPSKRLVYSVLGHDMEKIQVYRGDDILHLDRLAGQLSHHNNESTQHYPLAEIPGHFSVIFNNIVTNHHLLMTENRYFPPRHFQQDQAGAGIDSAPTIDDVIIVSHRGNVSPEQPVTENSLTGIRLAAEAGFEWVEIDLQITRDNLLVAYHDPFIETDNGKVYLEQTNYADLLKVPGLEDLTDVGTIIDRHRSDTKFLLELKPPSTQLYRQLEMASALVSLIKEKDIGENIIVDSFSRYMAAFVKSRCNCTVGYDAPFQQPLSQADLDDIASSNFDWVYVFYPVFNRDLLEAAHRSGLRVMVYTVNDINVVTQWINDGVLPDGILTDDQAVLALQSNPDS